MTGETGGYYADFADGPKALAKAYEKVFVNDGNLQRVPRPAARSLGRGFAGDRFLVFTQNHDQVGNRLKSDRHSASVNPAAARLAMGLLLLAPRIPMLFMGQEYGETNPFPFFCDFQDEDLKRAVREGRKAEFAHFGWKEEPADPLAASTRDSAVLSWDWSDPVRDSMRSTLLRTCSTASGRVPGLRDFEQTR